MYMYVRCFLHIHIVYSSSIKIFEFKNTYDYVGEMCITEIKFQTVFWKNFCCNQSFRSIIYRVKMFQLNFESKYVTSQSRCSTTRVTQQSQCCSLCFLFIYHLPTYVPVSSKNYVFPEKHIWTYKK